MENPLNIAVIGVGAIGGIITGNLAAAGHRLAVVEVIPGHRQKIAREGIRISGIRDFVVRPVSVHESIDALGNARLDIVVVALKATVLPAVAGEIAPLGNGQAPLVCFMNGIDSEQPLLQAAGPERVLRAAVNFGGNLAGDGHIKWAFSNPPTHLGGYAASSRDRAKDVARLFSAAGLGMEAVGDIRSYVWRKAIVNAMLATAVLTNLNIGEQLDQPDMRRLFLKIIEERIAVAEREKIDLGEGFFEYCVDFHERARQHIPPSALDIAVGRKTEVDFIEGKVIEYGLKHGVPVPTHETLYALVKGKESGLKE